MPKVSAVDIQHKRFRKALQGYDRYQVDKYPREVMESLEDEAHARAALEAENADLRERISHFKAMEESLRNTLILAQRTADEVKNAAHQKADLMLQEARVMAERETGMIDGRIAEARREYQHSLELAEKAKSELRSMLVMYLNLLDKQMNNAGQINHGQAASLYGSIARIEGETVAVGVGSAGPGNGSSCPS